jgi:hypothetical protein
MHRPVLTLLALASLCPAADGGGFLDGGVEGQWFANPELKGTPSFTRRDVRIDFDWGEKRTPGGSATDGFKDLGVDGYSVRWEGRLSPRLSETYTFTLTADDGAKLLIRREEDAEFKLLIDAWGKAGTSTATFAFIADERYVLRAEYREVSGPAKVRLTWSSPSLPEEVVESASIVGHNQTDTNMYADIVRNSRDEWRRIGPGDGPEELDASKRDGLGWPLCDATLIVSETNQPTGSWRAGGTYAMRYTGQAELVTAFNIGRFVVEDKEYTVLPKGVGYDAKTNTTSALMRWPDGAPSNVMSLCFTKTQRTAQSPEGSGITDLKLHRPLRYLPVGHADNQKPTPWGRYFHQPLIDIYRNFTTVRWILNMEKESEWADWTGSRKPEKNEQGRMMLENSKERYPVFYHSVSSPHRRQWEDFIRFSNETGKDLMVSVPIAATDQYITKLAKLLKYGSNGYDPYNSEADWPATGPVCPPLNPNLTVQVERSNEVWNFGFTQFFVSMDQGRKALAGGDPLGDDPTGEKGKLRKAVMNFDDSIKGEGQIQSQNIRWHALRTKEMSDLFRAVWGDVEMGRRVRMIFEYQYQNVGNSASDGLGLINDYFNNPKFVKEPKPVSYFFWGSGGAAYYGAADSHGVEHPHAAIADGDAEAQPVKVSVIDAPTAGWTASATPIPEGMVRPGAHRAGRVTPAQPQDLAVATQPTAVAPTERLAGLHLKLGAEGLTINEIGLWRAPGMVEFTHIFYARKNDRGGWDGDGFEAIAIGKAGKPGEMVWVPLTGAKALLPNTEYLLLIDDPRQFGGPSAVSVPAGVTLTGVSVGCAEGRSYDPGTYRIASETPTGQSLGGMGLRGIPASAAIPDLGGPPQAKQGKAYWAVQGQGILETTLDIPAPGNWGVSFLACKQGGMDQKVRFFLDDQEITPGGMAGTGLTTGQGWGPGKWGTPGEVWSIYSTAGFTVQTAGKRRLRIVGQTGWAFQDKNGNGTWEWGEQVEPNPVQAGDPGKAGVMYFDQIRLGSADATFGPGGVNMPGAGSAAGQVNAGNGVQMWIDDRYDISRYPQMYGLKVVNYEGGWSLGGDFDTTSYHNYLKYLDPRARDAQVRAANIAARSGIDVFTWGSYAQWESAEVPEQGPAQLQGLYAASGKLPASKDGGSPIPAILGVPQITWRDRDRTLWNVIVPATGDYTVAAELPAGGTASLEVDGKPAGTIASGKAATVRLSVGFHAVVVIAAKESTPSSITIANPKAPAAPQGVQVLSGPGLARVSWQAVPGATGYLVRWGDHPARWAGTRQVGNVTGALITGLADDVPCRVVVAAVGQAGIGSPSPEQSVIPLSPGKIGRLALWAFDNQHGDAASYPPTGTAQVAQVQPLTRGDGLKAKPRDANFKNVFGFQNGVDMEPVGRTRAEALEKGMWMDGSIAPAPGNSLSVSSIEAHLIWWDERDPRNRNGGLDVGVSRDGTTWTWVAATTVPIMEREWFTVPKYTADLSKVPAAQGLTAPLKIRLVPYRGPIEGEKRDPFGLMSFSYDSGDSKPDQRDDIVIRGSYQPSGTATAPPGLVGDLAMTPADGSVGVAWTAVPGATGYLVRAADGPNGPWKDLPKDAVKGTAATEGKLPNGRTRYYTVTALNAAGEGPVSPPVPASPSKVPAAIRLDFDGLLDSAGSARASALLSGAGAFSADGTGWSSKPGDRALSSSRSGGAAIERAPMTVAMAKAEGVTLGGWFRLSPLSHGALLDLDGVATVSLAADGALLLSAGRAEAVRVVPAKPLPRDRWVFIAASWAKGQWQVATGTAEAFNGVQSATNGPATQPPVGGDFGICQAGLVLTDGVRADAVRLWTRALDAKTLELVWTEDKTVAGK